MRRIFSVLALLAMVLSPWTMHRAEAAPSPAPTHHAEAAATHCGEAGQTSDQGQGHDRRADCALACSAMPSIAESLPAAAPIHLAYEKRPSPTLAGTAPGSDPPPPRTA